jgi:hypothetical protein
MRAHDEIWTVESSRSWTVDLRSRSFADCERVEMIHLQIHEMRDHLIEDRWIKRTRGERSEHHKAPSRSFAYRDLE